MAADIETRISELKKKISETELKLKKYKQQESRYRKAENEKKRKERTRNLIEIGAIIAEDKHEEFLRILQQDKEYAAKAHEACLKKIAEQQKTMPKK